MSQLASKGQLRMSFMRWTLVTVPAALFLGVLAGGIAGPTGSDAWFGALVKPAWLPPEWIFGASWLIFYAISGVAIAMILNARGARGRALAIGLYAVLLAPSLCWSPLLLLTHEITLAAWLILFAFAAAMATTVSFWRIRPRAGMCLVPILAWLGIVALYSWELDRLNPEGESLVPNRAATQILL